jgi:hypothetical protein
MFATDGLVLWRGSVIANPATTGALPSRERFFTRISRSDIIEVALSPSGGSSKAPHPLPAGLVANERFVCSRKGAFVKVRSRLCPLLLGVTAMIAFTPAFWHRSALRCDRSILLIGKEASDDLSQNSNGRSLTQASGQRVSTLSRRSLHSVARVAAVMSQ